MPVTTHAFRTLKRPPFSKTRRKYETLDGSATYKNSTAPE